MLAELLRELCKIEGLHWIRTLYTYPDRITDELLDTVASEPKLVKYFDIPLQHVNGEILKRMNLSHRAKHFPQQLSGGQQQRVAIARAVVTNPKLILADEPTGNLDSKNGAEVMNLLTELNKEGTSIVMVTHSQHDAGFAHRVIHLFDGSVVANIKE